MKRIGCVVAVICLMVSNISFGEWYETIKLKGDVRVRYQYDKHESDDEARHRERIRARIGLKAKPNDITEVGIRLASGGTDPRSTNETMDDNFETFGIMLDEAYMRFMPAIPVLDDFEVTAGKFSVKKRFQTPGDMLFDTDITMEGNAINLGKDVSEMFYIFLNQGFYWIDEIGADNTDPLMVIIQPGVQIDFMENFYFDLGLSFYTFANIRGAGQLEHAAGGNTLTAGGDYLYDYDVFSPSFIFGYRWNKYKASLGFEYALNMDSDADEKDAYYIGAKFGCKKVKDPLTWEMGINYRRIEADAWLDFLPDSDAYGGQTDVQGIELKGKVAVLKNVTLGMDYYHMDRIERTDNSEDLFQFDVVVKF